MESQSILSDTSYQTYEEYGDNLRIAAVRLLSLSLPPRAPPLSLSSLLSALCRTRPRASLPVLSPTLLRTD